MICKRHLQTQDKNNDALEQLIKLIKVLIS